MLHTTLIWTSQYVMKPTAWQQLKSKIICLCRSADSVERKQVCHYSKPNQKPVPNSKSLGNSSIYYFVSSLVSYSNLFLFVYSINFVFVRRPHQYCLHFRHPAQNVWYIMNEVQIDQTDDILFTHQQFWTKFSIYSGYPVCETQFSRI